MSKSDVDVVRAWKDPAYRRTLSAEQLAVLPAHPAGLVDISDEDLAGASGGLEAAAIQTTAPTCTQYSFLGWKSCGCGTPLTTAVTCTQYSFQGWKSCGC